MAQGRGRFSYRLDRVVRAPRGHHRIVQVPADLGQAVLYDIVGKRAVGFTLRHAGLEQHHGHDVARAGEAVGELAVGVQRLLRFLEQSLELRKLRAAGGLRHVRGPGPGSGSGLGRRCGALFDQVEELGDVDVARVDLRLGEEHGVTDDFRLRFGQLVGHLREHLARPRPAADVAEALVVDGDDRDLVGGRARSCCDAQVVGFALQARYKVAQPVEQGDYDDHRHAQEPVRLPEILHPAP
jgi:hypothetical protein